MVNRLNIIAFAVVLTILLILQTCFHPDIRSGLISLYIRYKQYGGCTNEKYTEHKSQTTPNLTTLSINEIVYFGERSVGKEFEINFKNLKMNKLPTDLQQTNESFDVMVFGYARGGSTYVGQIIGHHKDAFYFYEPLWTEEGGLKYYRNNYICEMNSVICRYDKSVDIQTYIDKLKSLYRCDMEPFINMFVRDWHRKKGGKAWSIPANSSSKNAILQKRCNQSKVRVAKVLRITGDTVEEMIKANTTLKIVYLYRDPRGIINSRLALQYKPNWNISMGTVKQIAEGLCHKMALDSKVLLRLKETYPKRIYFIAYETFAKNPTQNVREMFGFLGLSISESYLNHISKMGKQTGVSDMLWNSAFRSNGFATSIKWQHEMSTVDKIKIDQSCVEVYNRLGYKSVDINNLVNSSKNGETSKC